MARRRPNGEGSIYRYKGGYRVAVTIGQNEDGRRIRKYVHARTEKEAESKRDQLLRTTGSMDAAGSHRTVSDALDSWLTSEEVVRQPMATQDEYRLGAHTFIRPLLGQREVASLRPADVEQFVAQLNAMEEVYGVRDSSFTRAMLGRVLGEFLARCAREGEFRVVTDPRAWARVAHATCRVGQEDTARFLRALEGHPYEAYFKLLLLTHLEPSEVRGLCWDSVDFDNHVLTVRRALVTGGQEQGTFAWREVPERTVSFPEAIHSPLLKLYEDFCERHRKRTAAEERGWRILSWSHWEEQGLVFLTARGRPLSPSFGATNVRQVCESAGLPVLRLNELRRLAPELVG